MKGIEIEVMIGPLTAGAMDLQPGAIVIRANAENAQEHDLSQAIRVQVDAAIKAHALSR